MLEEFREQRKIHIRFAFQIVMDILLQLQTLPTLVDVTIPDGASFTVCGVRLPQTSSAGWYLTKPVQVAHVEQTCRS